MTKRKNTAFIGNRDWIICDECEGWPWELTTRDGSDVQDCFRCDGEGGWNGNLNDPMRGEKWWDWQA